MAKPTAAVRVEVGHLGFNVVGAAVWIGFVGQLTWLAERLPGGTTDRARALVNAHTVFNVVNAVVALAATRRELGHLSSMVIAMSQQIPSIVLTGSHGRIDRLALGEVRQQARLRVHESVSHLVVAQSPMPPPQTRELVM